MLKKLDVNVQNLLDLANYFDRLDPNEYDQTKYDDCICGHCNRRNMYQASDHKAAAHHLGMTDLQALTLFKMEGGRHTVNLGFGLTHTHVPTPADAAKCLRYIAVTGEVPSDW